jgi:hypothetical protein
MDHYMPFIPEDWQPKPLRVDIGGTPSIVWPPQPTIDAATIEALRAEIVSLAKIVTDFKTAVEAARKVDALTAQPDCEDPEKAKLEARVAELERRLDAVSKALGA